MLRVSEPCLVLGVGCDVNFASCLQVSSLSLLDVQGIDAHLAGQRAVCGELQASEVPKVASIHGSKAGSVMCLGGGGKSTSFIPFNLARLSTKRLTDQGVARQVLPQRH